MTLQQLNYLKVTAECGNITQAAEKLFISQPSLSAALHNLEKEMGGNSFCAVEKRSCAHAGRRRTSILCRDAFRAGGYYERTLWCRKRADT